MNSKTVGLILGGLALGSAILPLQAQMATTLNAPTNVSPANGSTLTTSQFTLADWTDVSGSSTPITYRYESSNSSSTNPDGSFTSPIYQSGALSSSQISTNGTAPGTYFWHARAVDNAGATSTWSAPWSVTVTSGTSTPTTTPDCAAAGSNSFNACYYQGQNFDTFKLNRTDPQINFDWGGGSPDPQVPTDHFSAKWLGSFAFDSGTYRFTVTTDDGMRLKIDGSTVIDKWFDQPATTYTYDQTMTAGQHTVGVEYYEDWGNAVAKVSWQKLSGTTTPPTPSGNYYPNANPSAWYILPGQQLSFSGSGFAPNESVAIQGDSVNTSVMADGSGHLTADNVLTIPYSWANSQHTFTLTGSTSDGNVTPKPITIQVGTFYPQLNPSSWWIGYSQGMSASATGFAPGEQVKFMVNGTQVAQTAADGSGNVTFNFTTPASGGTATLTAQGLSSGLSASQTIYLHS